MLIGVVYLEVGFYFLIDYFFFYSDEDIFRYNISICWRKFEFFYIRNVLR